MDLTNYLRKDTSGSTVYYGYSSDSNAASTDFNWSIRKVTTSGSTIETVTWSNGDQEKTLAKWNDRAASFAAPSGSLGLTCSKGTQIGNSVPLNITWNQLSGANRYQIVVSKSSIIYSDSGNQVYYNPSFNNSQITTEIVNGSSYTFNYAQWTASASNVYSIALTAVNVTGSSSSTTTVNT
jgi:hypothetical protein